jgi:hypothetical protein
MKLILRTPLLSKVYEVVPLPSIETSSMKLILKSFSVYSYVGCVPKRLAANADVWAVAGDGRANEGGTTDLPDRFTPSAVTVRYLKN